MKAPTHPSVPSPNQIAPHVVALSFAEATDSPPPPLPGTGRRGSRTPKPVGRTKRSAASGSLFEAGSRTAKALAPEERAANDSAEIKDWCLARASEWYAQGELGAARNFLNHAASLDPHDIQTWIALGSVHFALGSFERAGQAFHRAAALNPTDPRVFMHLGLTHQQLGHADEAEALLRHSVALEPDNVTALGLLGGFLTASGRHAEAREQLTRASKLVPEDTELLLRLGACCFKLHDLAAARDCYHRILRRHPEHPIARDNLRTLDATLTTQRA